MSRLAAQPVALMLGPDDMPVAVVVGRVRLCVTEVLDRWREWFDVLDGWPERDVWILDTDAGICEVHGLRSAPLPQEPDGQGTDWAAAPIHQWLLSRWED